MDSIPTFLNDQYHWCSPWQHTEKHYRNYVDYKYCIRSPSGSTDWFALQNGVLQSSVLSYNNFDKVMNEIWNWILGENFKTDMKHKKFKLLTTIIKFKELCNSDAL